MHARTSVLANGFINYLRFVERRVPRNAKNLQWWLLAFSLSFSLASAFLSTIMNTQTHTDRQIYCKLYTYIYTLPKPRMK